MTETTYQKIINILSDAKNALPDNYYAGENIFEIFMGEEVPDFNKKCDLTGVSKDDTRHKWKYEHNDFIDYIEKNKLSYEVVDNYGGEDCGSDFYTIYKFTLDGENCFIKFQGWYQSYEGSEYESHREVNPVQKTVTTYE